jgi:hypothetical protein
MTTLEEKINLIIDHSDFNDLPFEERKRICKYLTEQQILTLWQTLKKYPDLTTEAWRKKQRAWLKNCVETYDHEYGEK